MKQAIVLGAGIIGLNTAYALESRGYEVLVLERRSGAGLETSFANGAQLSYSYVAPLAEPTVPGKLGGWLLDRNSPMRFKPSLEPAELCWGVRFLKECRSRVSAQTTSDMLTLSGLSQRLFQEMLPELGGIDYSQTGKLVMHRSEASFQHAKAQLDLQARLGCTQSALGIEACIELEPALAGVRSEMAGGIFTPSEASADGYQICQSLYHVLKNRGVQFRFDAAVESLRAGADQRVSVHTHDGTRHEAEVIVIALGNGAAALLQQLNIRVPISPLKGYSLTLPIARPDQAPKINVTDFEKKVVYARLGNRLRIAGMADRVGYDLRLDPERLNLLKRQAKELFPLAGDYDHAEAWAGLRPATPKSKPIIDGASYRNLWCNIGHGALGLTLAPGSAALLAQLIEGEAPSINPKPFSLAQA